MRWKANEPFKEPRDGAKRIKKKFCLFPRKYFGIWVWLETVQLLQKYSSWDGWVTEAILHKDKDRHV